MNKNIENRPEEISMSYKSFFLLCIILLIILAISIIYGAKGLINPYLSAIIAILSFIGFILLMLIAKKHDEENGL